MIKIDFNEKWRYRRLSGKNEWKSVDLPHDAMIGEPRSGKSLSGINSGWFECYDYEYEKSFTVPEEYAEKDIIFEFEGVYHNAEVYINGQKAAYRPYGYTNFYVCANECDGYIKYVAGG